MSMDEHLATIVPDPTGDWSVDCECGWESEAVPDYDYEYAVAMRDNHLDEAR